MLIMLGILIGARVPLIPAQNPATLSGTIRCGASSGCGSLSYSTPIDAPFSVSAHRTDITAPDIYAFFTAADNGHYQTSVPAVSGSPLATYDLYASGVGYQSTLLVSNFAVQPGQHLHFDGYLQPCGTCLIETATSVTCGSSTVHVGSSTTCSVTVAALGTLSAEIIAWSQTGGTGSVAFPSGDTCALSGASCPITVTGSNVGSVTLQAFYPGDSANDPSQGSFPLTINPTTTTAPLPVGGEMIPINQLRVLMSWLALIAVLSIIPVEILIRRRGIRNN